MGYVSDSVLAEYQKIDPEAPAAPIDRADVEEATTILRTLRIHKTREVFLYLSAINLLNAAIKQAEYKNELSYGFIKRKARLAGHPPAEDRHAPLQPREIPKPRKLLNFCSFKP